MKAAFYKKFRFHIFVTVEVALVQKAKPNKMDNYRETFS